ncbi:MAG: Clp protease ClpP [Candidatus Micrarchaeia archaeon]|jgi:ATP-dependent protease ClpP protease subunit
MEMKWSNKAVPDVPTKSSGEILVHEPRILETIENRIYFYSEIGRPETLQLVRAIRQMDNDNLVRKQIRDEPALTPIFLHINSYGGSVFAGLSAMDNIMACQSKVITVVDGICASAATFLSVVGKERLITRHSMMLIHQLSTMFWGKYSEFKDEKENLDRLMAIIKSIYLQFTKIPPEVLDGILEHDIFFDSETCLNYGMVDRII